MGGDAEQAPSDPESVRKAHQDRSRLEPAPNPDDEPGPIPPHMRVKPIPPEGAPRIAVAGHDDLKLRNWKEIATAVEEMRLVSREMIEKGPPKADETARMETNRRRMQRFIANVVDRPRGIEPTAPVTESHHPAFVVNLVAAMLERASLPLTEAQAKRLADLAAERGPVIDAAEADMKKDDPETWFIGRVAARATLADEFYAEVYAVLTPAQAEVIAPSDLRGRVMLDIVSSAASWGRIARPILFADEQRLVANLTAGVGSVLGVPERADEIRPIVETWVREGGFDAADALDRKGFTRTSHISRAVPRTIDLFNRVIDALKLPAEAAQAAHANNAAYVPLRQ